MTIFQLIMFICFAVWIICGLQIYKIFKDCERREVRRKRLKEIQDARSSTNSPGPSH